MANTKCDHCYNVIFAEHTSEITTHSQFFISDVATTIAHTFFFLLVHLMLLTPTTTTKMTAARRSHKHNLSKGRVVCAHIHVFHFFSFLHSIALFLSVASCEWHDINRHLNTCAMAHFQDYPVAAAGTKKKKKTNLHVRFASIVFSFSFCRCFSSFTTIDNTVAI